MLTLRVARIVKEGFENGTFDVLNSAHNGSNKGDARLDLDSK